VTGAFAPSRRKSSAPDGAVAERQLARWVAEGDDEALAELFDLVGPMLYSLARGITKDPRLTEHALEHIFAELWERRAGLTRLPALSPWLTERCRAWAIAIRTGTEAPAPRSMAEMIGRGRLAGCMLRCPPGLRRSRLAGALERLSPAERQAVLLASGEGLGVGEIAERIGLEGDRVHELLRTGLRSLRDGLERTLRREMP
jgi:RNA polymerase sigma-70 factor, ECF subfamily